jgi:exodeoxyribonuclease VII small subunit
MSKEKEIKFEAALGKLEEIVRTLEEGDLSLDDSLRMFEEGVKLSKLCGQKLDAAERRIEILMKDGQGEETPRPFTPPDRAEGR